jgi:hypothetical protein
LYPSLSVTGAIRSRTEALNGAVAHTWQKINVSKALVEMPKQGDHLVDPDLNQE